MTQSNQTQAKHTVVKRPRKLPKPKPAKYYLSYLGRKTKLLPFLEYYILGFMNNNGAQLSANKIETTGNEPAPDKFLDNGKYIFCDLFAGTGIVAENFQMLNFETLANDWQEYSQVLCNALLKPYYNPKTYAFNKVYQKIHNRKTNDDLTLDLLADDIAHYQGLVNAIYVNVVSDLDLFGSETNSYEHIRERNTQKDWKYHIFDNYTAKADRLYFTPYNALAIDVVRQQIEQDYQTRLRKAIKYYDENPNSLVVETITLDEYHEQLTRLYNTQIALLISASDKVANVASVYEAFLKSLKGSADKPLDLQGALLRLKGVDWWVFRDGKSKITIPETKITAICASQIKNKPLSDKPSSHTIAYIDPPYNRRKYSSNYHILETIADYADPEPSGKSGIRHNEKDKHKTNLFGTKRHAFNEITKLIETVQADWVFLSYNNKGTIPISDLLAYFKAQHKEKGWIVEHHKTAYNNFISQKRIENEIKDSPFEVETNPAKGKKGKTDKTADNEAQIYEYLFCIYKKPNANANTNADELSLTAGEPLSNNNNPNNND